jgi:hypothetical protein
MAELSGNPQIGRAANGVGERGVAARADAAVAVERERVVEMIIHCLSSANNGAFLLL